MASYKVKFRLSKAGGDAGVLVYHFTHEGKVREVTTAYRLHGSEWDERSQAPDPAARQLVAIRQALVWDRRRIAAIIASFEARGVPYTVDDVTGEYRRCASLGTIITFGTHTITAIRANGLRSRRTAETFATRLRCFRKFRGGEDIRLEGVTDSLMQEWESWMKGRGLVPNSVSFYMRIMRAIYNRAVEQSLIPDVQPFRHVYTGVSRTVKRALPSEVVKSLSALDLADCPNLAFARDIFLLSFALRGMSFIDMAFLRKSDLSDGAITYRRRKTGQLLTIAWTARMQEILDRYPENTTPFLLPIITKKGEDESRAYKRVGASVNRGLKQLAKLMGIPGLTMYTARHSWATIAHSKGVPVSVISDAMGHDSEATTRIYLAELDTAVVDQANALVLGGIL